jgi:hypothetical protein
MELALDSPLASWRRGEIGQVAGTATGRPGDSYIEEWPSAFDLAILVRTTPLIFHDPRAY